MKLQDLVNRVNTKPDEKKNGALNTYIQNNTQNKGRLDNPVSTLINMLKTPQKSEITDEEFYNYVYKELDGLEYTIEDIDKVANSPILYGGVNYKELGLALSALINKVAKKGDKIQLNMSRPVDHLFYLADGIEAHVNVAGSYLGYNAKNSKIYAGDAWGNAGYCMNNCELHANAAGNYLGDSAKNSKIYAGNAGDYAGLSMDNCELHVNIAGDYLGANANNSKIYANETGYNTGMNMKNSKLYLKLYIKDLIGEFGGSYFKGRNEIYLGKESYKLHPINYRLRRVKIWETP